MQRYFVIWFTNKESKFTWLSSIVFESRVRARTFAKLRSGDSELKYRIVELYERA